MMQDGKALQAGTSHFLGQNFAKAFDVKFATKEGGLEYVWGTSWGVSTRLMGALIMAHSDDHGLVLPPKLAPFQVVIIPIYRSSEELDIISKKVNTLMKSLRGAGISVKFDNRDTQKPGWKFAEYELKGVPVRFGIGPRDVENGTIEIARRDTLTKELFDLSSMPIELKIASLLDDIQTNIFEKARIFKEEMTTEVNSWKEFEQVLGEKGGFLSAHWDGTAETEDKIKASTKATIRCIPLSSQEEIGICVLTGLPSTRRVLFAKAY
jgi:prolyl-tRNA synthetase